MPDIVDHVRNHLPRCLSGVTATPIEGEFVDRGGLSVVFLITSSDQKAYRILGYDLSEYNPEHKGPLEFISPLTLRWGDDSTHCIFDSDIHGYNGEMDSSAKMRGRGEAMTFPCPKCRCDIFLVGVQFNYHDDLFDEFEVDEVSDLYHNIIIHGTCSSCFHQVSVLDMDL